MPMTEEEKAAKAKSDKAKRELVELESNESTQALAALPDILAF